MEELQYMLSKESLEGTAISLQEIQNLDKQKLAENLTHLDDTTKQALLVGLKQLIQSRMSLLKTPNNHTQEKQSIVYALQIFGNLSGIEMPIDGNYSPQLHIPELQQLFQNTKEKKPTLGEKIGLPMDQLKDAKNINDFLNTTLETVVKKYAQKLNTPEGMSLKTTDIYKDLVAILQQIDTNLPAGNIYKGNSALIIDNFLTPRENAEKLIASVIDKILHPNEKKIQLSDIESLKIGLKGFLGTMIDGAKTQDDGKLKDYIQEIKHIPLLKQYIDKFPEFDQVLDILISLLKGLDKTQIFAQLDTFFAKNSHNMLQILQKAPGEEVPQKVKLEVMNGAWKIVDSAMNEKTVSVGLEKVSQLKFLSKNPVVSQILDIVNNSKLSPKDKLNLFQQVSSLVGTVTNPDIRNPKDQSDQIKNSLNVIMVLLGEFNKQGKIDETKVVALVKELIHSDKKSGVLETIKKLKNIDEIASFLSDNLETIKALVFNSINGKDALEEAIRHFIRTYQLSDNIAKAGGNLVQRIERAFSLNTADMILSIRQTLLEAKTQSSVGEKTTQKTIAQKAAQDIGGIVSERVSAKGLELLKTKLALADGPEKKLTKQDIIQSVLSGLDDILQDPQLRKKIFENSKKLGVPVDNKELFIQNVGKYILNNPEFKNILDQIATLLLSRLGNAKNIAEEMNRIQGDINRLFHDFSRNYEKFGVSGVIKTAQETSLVDEKTKADILKAGTSVVYDYMKNPKNVALLVQSFPEISRLLPEGISPEKTANILSGVLLAVPKEVFSSLFSDIFQHPSQIETLKNPESILGVVKNILSHPEVKKDQILETIIHAELGKNLEKKDGNQKIMVLTPELMASGVDTLYTLLGTSSHEQINALTESLGLNHIFSGAIEATMKHIPKEVLKKALVGNREFINQAANGQIDPNGGLKFISEIYKDIPTEKRLGVVDSILSRGNLAESSGGQPMQIDSQNSRYITDIVYATIQTGDSEQLKKIATQLFPGIGELLNQKVAFGVDTMTLGLGVLGAIPKETFYQFLSQNAGEINQFLLSHDTQQATMLALKLSKGINGNELKQFLHQKSSLGKNEIGLLDMTSSFQTALEKNKDKLDRLRVVGEKLKHHIDTGAPDIKQSGITPTELSQFSSDLFDIIHDTLSGEFTRIMQQEGFQQPSDARVYLSEKFELPASQSGGKVDMSKIHIGEFFMNNPGFSLYWGGAYIFKGKEYVVKNAGIDYFSDASKKGDFERLVKSYFA